MTAGTESQDDFFIFVELKEKSFEKYIKARADVERPGWFKCSNRILDDDELYDFSAAEICAWLYIMEQSSIHQNPKVRLILDKVDAYRRKFSRDDLRNAITKLRELGILKGVTSAVRPRNVDVTLGEERIGEDSRVVVVTACAREETPPAANASQNKIIGSVLTELGGNSKRVQALSTVPLDLQQEWVDTYDPLWLKNTILKAISTYANKDPVETVKNWEGKLVHWFSIEQKPKFKPKPTAGIVRELTTNAHSLTPISDILGQNPELAKLRAAIGVRSNSC